jgi:hypothetical protein
MIKMLLDPPLDPTQMYVLLFTSTQFNQMLGKYLDQPLLDPIQLLMDLQRNKCLESLLLLRQFRRFVLILKLLIFLLMMRQRIKES